MLRATQKIKKEMSVNIMWKSWGTEDELSTPANEPSTPGSPSMLAVSAPSGAAEAVRSHGVRSNEIATIGQSLVVKGDLSGSEDLVVDGEVDGSIALHGQSLTVLPNGRVRANIGAGNVVVQGRG